MARSSNISSRFGLPLLLLGAVQMVVLNSGCIRTDRSDCPPEIEEILIVKVIDLNSGADISDEGRVRSATLYVFDEDGNYIEQLPVTEDDIANERDIEIPLSGYTGSFVQVSAWGNIANQVSTMSDLTAGNTMNTPFLSLLPNTAETGYDQCPGEIFFGTEIIHIGRLSTRETIIEKQEIDLKQKNGRLAITVEGLPEDMNDEDYYFKMCNQNDGYDFAGNPVFSSTCEIVEAGTFLGNGNYVSPSPYHLIHSIDPDNVDETTAVMLHLFQTYGSTGYIDNPDGTRASADDIDLTEGGTNKDTNDEYIAIYPGKTTNVLIKFASENDPTYIDGFDVQVVVTDWDEVYQWTTWN